MEYQMSLYLNIIKYESKTYINKNPGDIFPRLEKKIVPILN